MAEHLLPLSIPLNPPSGGGQRRVEPALLRPFARQEPLAETLPQLRIVIAGVGGAGINTLGHIGRAYGDILRLVALNTDAQMLAHAVADDRLCLGEAITQGMGAGGSPDVGGRAAEASRHHIAALLKGADLVFVTAGLGGGTGTGAAPIVARIAHEQGALVVGMVTLPFTFEGMPRRKIALAGHAAIAAEVDALVTIPNDRLLHAVGQDQTLNGAFVLANEAVRQGIIGVVEIMTQPGLINVDFADVRAVLRGAGPSLLAVGEGSGPDRAALAVEDAISGGWLRASIAGARRVLLNIAGGDDLSLVEVTQIADGIMRQLNPQAECIFGAVIDPACEDAVRVTVLAAGVMADLA